MHQQGNLNITLGASYLEKLLLYYCFKLLNDDEYERKIYRATFNLTAFACDIV